MAISHGAWLSLPLRPRIIRQALYFPLRQKPNVSVRPFSFRHDHHILSTMIQRRSHSTSSSDEKPNKEHKDHHHDHSHSHSLFHSHSHSEEGYNYGAEKIVAAWEGAGDKGSQITLIGLFSNIGLTGVKGVAGWYLHSASLLADAGHSLSDLLGDIVVLVCWKLSRKPPTERYPFGFAKFETLGATTMSILLIGGALGIGFHSYNLLIHTLTETVSTMPTGTLQGVLENVTSAAPPVPDLFLHHHDHDVVDPNAAWFAALSIGAKEWLYRATKKIADEENSPVLLANAVHHRSDVFSSAVALCAILGSWLFPALPLDPFGGLLVSFIILRQSFSLLHGTWADLTDAGVPPHTRESLVNCLDPIISSTTTKPRLLGITDLRARRAGSLVYVDLTAQVEGESTIHDIVKLDAQITATMKEERKEVAEVRVKFKPVSL